MENQLEELFQTRKNKTISLGELESFVSGSIEYQHFANVILSFEEKGVLTRIKSHGETGRVPSLAYTYRINKSILRQSHHNTLKRMRLMLHPAIRLEAYFHLPVEEWERNFPFIEMVSNYIEQQGFPKEKVPGPERSFEIVGNEKWITDEGGYELLERIDVWDKLLINPVSDPIMFAINPLTTQETHHKHLIVENKTTYQGLLPALQESHFTTLIYGSGKKIIKSMEQFAYQIPLPGTHEFFYFGDLDHEGISIWYSLSKKISAIKPALPFYTHCFNKKYVYGKAYQRPNEEALNAFLPYLPESHQIHLKDLLNDGGYYPQEIIKTNELQQIWRDASWK